MEHAQCPRSRIPCPGHPARADGLHAYFVHSFHLVTSEQSECLADADYGGPVTAVVAHDTAAGPSSSGKSQRSGLRLIAEFPEMEAMTAVLRRAQTGFIRA